MAISRVSPARGTTSRSPVPAASKAARRSAELRTAIRELFAGRVAGERPPVAALEVVNGAARLAPAVPVLRWDGGPARGTETVSGTGSERTLARLAADAIELVAGADAPALVECGAPDCIRFLVRNHGKRQWCSTRCGDRVRAARHYARRSAVSRTSAGAAG